MPDNRKAVNLIIKYFGGRQKAAEALGISYSHLGHLVNGRRQITPRLAARIEEKTNNLFTRQELIW